MKPLISVIVPIYNVEQYLNKCLDSIIGQSYQNLEIILVDDGSTDSSGVICDDYAKQDNRIHVIHQKNSGVSAARNVGLDWMRGEYLLFVDSDDWLSLDAVQILYNRLVDDGSDMVIGQMVKIFDNGKTKPSYCSWMTDMVITGNKGLEMLASETPIPCYVWGKLVKKSVYESLRFPELCRAEDVWMIPYVLEECRKISLESRILYYYYQRPTSAVHASNDRHWLDGATGAFHVSRFFIKREMWHNAAVYCMSGLAHLRQVKDVKQARQLMKKTFLPAEIGKIVKRRPRCIQYLAYLYMPQPCMRLRILWKRIRNKEC